MADMTSPHSRHMLFAFRSSLTAATGALRSLAAWIRARVVVYGHGMFARSLQAGPERCARPHQYDIEAR
jgi:hypothetical protein